MFSRAVRWLYTPAPCDSTPMERRAASGSAATLRPSMKASPASGASTVYSMRSVVDLPAPFGPNNPVIWPSRALKLTSRTAAILPNDLTRPRASNMALPARSGRRPGQRDEERHGFEFFRAIRVERFRAARGHKIPDDAVDAGSAELPVTVAGDDYMFAVGERALRQRGVCGRCHRVVSPGE